MIPPEAARTALARCLGAIDPGPDACRWSAASGGMSDAQVWKAEAGERSYAVRRLPGWATPSVRTSLGEVLRQATRALPCIAAPMAPPLELAGAWGSELWEVAPWRAGSPLTEHDRDDARAAVICLAELHRELSSVQPDGRIARASWSDRLERLGNLASTRSPEISAATADAFPDLAAAVEHLPHAAALATDRLRQIPIERSGSQLIHGDARPEHFLIESGRVTGLIDFDAMRVDSPLTDVARLAGEVALGNGERLAELTADYSEAAGVRVDAATIGAIDGANAVLAAENWASWLRASEAAGRDPGRLRERLASIRARLPS